MKRRYVWHHWQLWVWIGSALTTPIGLILFEAIRTSRSGVTTTHSTATWINPWTELAGVCVGLGLMITACVTAPTDPTTRSILVATSIMAMFMILFVAGVVIDSFY